MLVRSSQIYFSLSLNLFLWFTEKFFFIHNIVYSVGIQKILWMKETKLFLSIFLSIKDYLLYKVL